MNINLNDPLTITLLVIIIFSLVGYVFSNDDGEDYDEVKLDDDTVIFKSAFSRGGDLIVPQKLIFTKSKVVLETNHGLKELYTSTTRQTIPYTKLAGVNITRNVVGCNITLIGHGVQNIIATNFTGKDANKIEEIVNKILNC